MRCYEDRKRGHFSVLPCTELCTTFWSSHPHTSDDKDHKHLTWPPVGSSDKFRGRSCGNNRTLATDHSNKRGSLWTGIPDQQQTCPCLMYNLDPDQISKTDFEPVIFQTCSKWTKKIKTTKKKQRKSYLWLIWRLCWKRRLKTETIGMFFQLQNLQLTTIWKVNRKFSLPFFSLSVCLLFQYGWSLPRVKMSCDALKINALEREFLVSNYLQLKILG